MRHEAMAKKKKSVSRKRSPKQLKHDQCMRVQIPKQKKDLLKSPKYRKLEPRKLHQKAFGKAIQACKK